MEAVQLEGILEYDRAAIRADIRDIRARREADNAAIGIAAHPEVVDLSRD